MIELRDRDRIERFLRQDPIRHVYAIGDLDDAFWPHTRWWGLERAGELAAVVLLYDGLRIPTCLALGSDVAPLRDLFSDVANTLPDEVYLHLEPGLSDLARAMWELTDHGLHLRMALADPSLLPDDDDPGTRWLTPDDRAEVTEFYRKAFPENWFDPRTLESGCYVGLEEDGKLAALAGVHVWSATHRVAALGNIATMPGLRGRGFGRRVTAAVTRNLVGRGWAVGLNVAEANGAAVRVYERLGFARYSTLEEWAARS